jgi:O-acetyl-ADP-ribose deacetylase (regulator of RNase III)
LDLAKANDLHSIAFPSISTGKFSYPKKEACAIAVKTVHDWLRQNEEYDMKIVFSCVDPRIYDLIMNELKGLGPPQNR